MIDYRNTRPISWTTIAVVCAIGALAWYGLYRLALAGARWVGVL